MRLAEKLDWKGLKFDVADDPTIQCHSSYKLLMMKAATDSKTMYTNFLVITVTT
jgi:hypothetical protein